MNPKISVIIPVYKVEAYLRQCLDSIVNQTYRNLEIIIVDDGSPDNCGKICDEYAAKDERITVIHKENGGLSAARNDGITRATGKWISFVDSDDWCELDLYEKAVAFAEKTDTDIAIYSFYEGSSKKEGTETRIHTFDKDFITEDRKILFQLQLSALSASYIPYSNTKPWTMGYPWDKLFKASLIVENGLSFAENVKANEDVIFNIHAFQYANKVSFVDLPLYHWRVNPTSIGHKYTPNRVEINNEIYNEYYRIGNLYHFQDEYYQALNVRIINNTVALFDQCLFNYNNPAKLIDKLKYTSKVLHSEPIYSAFENVDINRLACRRGKILAFVQHDSALLSYVLTMLSRWLGKNSIFR